MFSVVRIMVKGMLVLSVLLIIGVGALAVRLSMGPIEIGFLRPTIERGLSAADGSYRVKSGGAVVSWEGWEHGLRLTLTDVELSRADRSVFASVPRISVRLDGGSLLGGRLEPSEVAVHKPQLLLRRSADGQITLGLARGKRQSRAGFVPGLISALRNDAKAPPALSKLRSVRIVDADLIVEDAYLERTWRTSDFDVTVKRDGGRLAADMSFNLHIGRKTIRFSARAAEKPNSDLVQLSFRFTRLDPALFRAARGPMAALEWFKLPLAGEFHVSADRSLRIRQAHFRISGRNGVLRVPATYSRGLPVRQFRLTGEVSGDGSILQINRLMIDLNGPKLTLAGKAVRREGLVDFKGTFSLDGFPTDRLEQFWPEQAKSKARTWVSENISGGRVTSLDVAVTMQVVLGKQAGIVLQRLRGAFRYAGMQVRFFKHMPPVRDAHGFATFDDRGMKFTIEKAKLEDLKLIRASVDIDGFRDPVRHLKVDARVSGNLQTALKIIDREPLGFSRKLGVSPLAISGQVNFGIRIWVGLLSPVDFKDVGLDVDADLTGVRWRKGFFGLSLSRAQMKLLVKKTGMTVTGRGLLEGKPARFTWTEAFRLQPVRRRMTLTGRFSTKDLPKIGYDPGSLIQGDFGARLNMEGRVDGTTRLDGVFDVTPATVTLPLVGVRKPPGKRAVVRLNLAFRNQRLQAIRSIYLKGAGLDLAGHASFYPVQPPRMRRLVVTRLRAGRTDLAATLDIPLRGPRRLLLKGKSLDISRTIDMRGRTSDEPMPPMIIRAQVARVYFRPGYPISDFNGTAVFDGSDWRSIDAQARVGGGPVVARLVDSSTRRRLSFRAANAGATLRALNVFDEIQGGRIRVDAVINDVAGAELFVGKASMTKFRIQDAPAAARVLALASVRGIGNFNAKDKGIAMDEFVAPVRFQRGRIEVRNGRVVGSELGITLNGWVDLKTDKVNIRGTIVPAYSINNLLGRLTAAAKGSGLFAASYRVSGTFKKPNVVVNPLSVIAPPLLRRLFNTYSGKEDGDPAKDPGRINNSIGQDSIGR